MSDIPKSISLLFDKIKYKNFIHFFTIPLRYLDKRCSFWKYLIRKICTLTHVTFSLRLQYFHYMMFYFTNVKSVLKACGCFDHHLYMSVYLFTLLFKIAFLYYSLRTFNILEYQYMSKYTIKRSFICNKFVIYSLYFLNIEILLYFFSNFI